MPAKGEIIMKKHMSLFVGAVALLTAVPAIGATNTGTRAASSADLNSAPAKRERVNVDYNKYETRTSTNVYEVEDAGDLYYTKPVKRSELYKQQNVSSANSTTTTRQVRKTRAETVRSEVKRKYFLAHPFFQPLKGKFGSVTDFSYNMGSYNVDLTALDGFTIQGLSSAKAKWTTDQFTIKEDFSYGITDKIAVLGMAQYDSSKYKLKWDVAGVEEDSMDDNGLNLFGIGPQFRFLDNENWIGEASAFYQHQKDVVDDFVLELKAGYKIASSTVYGLVRGWYLSFDGDSYGNGITGTTPDGINAGLYLAYKTNSDTAYFVEGGLGVFSVLEQDWTLNLEAIFGDYDWHNQASVKAAIGWQPNDWFALNLYAKTSFYDSADDKKLGYYYYGALNEITNEYVYEWVQHGTAKVSDYNETSIGLQAIFMF